MQGDKHPYAKLREVDVELIRLIKSEGGRMSDVHKELFPYVSYSTVKEAGNGNNWRYV